MSDLINRDGVLAYTEKQHKLNKVFESEDAYICFWEGINDREGELKSVNTNTNNEMGEWEDMFFDEELGGTWEAVCSLCKVPTYTKYSKVNYPFCPNCGKPMKQEKEYE